MLSRLVFPPVAAASLILLTSSADAAKPRLPDNLAKTATTSATSEHNHQYLSKFAVDGKIPPAGSQAADRGAAWCVLKEKSGDQADFAFQWKQPVEAAQIVYFGRTAWFVNECWKDFEVYLDDGAKPAAKGTLKMMHGPQPIAFPKTKLQKITIKFLNSYGGYNPGAAEIMVFGENLSKEQLATLRKSTGATAVAGISEAGPDSLRRLIGELKKIHGDKYAKADEHLARFNDCKDDAEKLAELQREVLLFDVDKLLGIKRYEITATHVYTYHYEGQKNGGGLYVMSAADPTSAPREIVASPEGQILDCDLSYDGKTALFSWRRKSGEGYHIWSVNVDGSNLKQLTDGQWHDYNACWLPDGDVAFLSTRNPQFAYCWHAPVGILHRMDADGKNVKRISANYLNDFTPYVLEDGRIIFTRWEYVDRPAIPIQSLWAINPDGTGLSGFFGNRVLTPGTFMEARQIPGTNKIICTMTGHNGPTRGAIGVVDITKGANAQEAIENVTPDSPIGPINSGNGNTGGSKPYSCPLPLDRERFLVSARGPILIRTIDGTCKSVALPRAGDGMQYFNAQPIKSRPRPRVIPVRRPKDPEPFATIYMENVYNGLEPYVEKGEVKTIRIVSEMQKTVRIDPGKRAFGFQFPVISCGATYAGKEVLGEVPVEKDGSALFRVPANKPVYFMAIDAKGRAVQRMRTFTHFKPGEVQGCVGCHADRNASTPPRMGVGFDREPVDLTPPEWGAGGFDFSRIVQPILDRHCTACHDAYNAPDGIDLSGDKTDYFNVAYDVLAREKQGRTGSPYVNWIPSYNGQEWNILEVKPKTWGSPASKLTEVILDGHVDEKGKPRFELDEKERRRILAWIDLNVPYYGTSETAYPDARGCRQLYPKDLDRVLADVVKRRCAECHKGGKIPRREWVRITNPELNNFLLAPLSKVGGGLQKCGEEVIFEDADDPDYQAILATFRPIQESLKKTPRMDMPGAEPSCDVNRSCQ